MTTTYSCASLLPSFFSSEPVDILTHPVDVVNYTAGTAQFLCLASGIPAPAIFWFRNNTQISADEERITIDTSITVIDNEQNTTSVLTIDNLQISDTAYYHCTASNDGAVGTDVTFGAISINASLFVECKCTVFFCCDFTFGTR